MCQAIVGQGSVEVPTVAGAAVITVLQIAWSQRRLGGEAGDRRYEALYVLLRGFGILNRE